MTAREMGAIACVSPAREAGWAHTDATQDTPYQRASLGGSLS